MTEAQPARTFSATRNIRLLYVATIVAGTVPFLPIWIIYLTDMRGLTLAQVGLMETFFWGVAPETFVVFRMVASTTGREPKRALADLPHSDGRQR